MLRDNPNTIGLIMRRLPRLLAVFLLLLSAQVHSNSETNNLQLVGEATLTKLFWTIYDSRLYTHSGTYRGIEPGLVLEITYRRQIRAEQLIETTRDEWQELELYEEPSSETWLTQLESIWPDVTKGDVISLRVGPQLESEFFFNGEPTGTIEEETFSHHFLAIWLSPENNYPRLRKRLIGNNYPTTTTNP